MRYARPVLAALALAALAGCANDSLNESRGRGDAPVGVIDDGARDVLQFPDRFGNVAHGCDGHGHRVYVTTRVEGVGVQMEVLDDPTCGGR